MNEPGTTPEMPTRVVTLEPTTSENARRYGASVTPTWGITVGMTELMAAGEVWVVVTGSHKTDILNRTLHGAVDSEVPATFLTEHPTCTFFVDEAAFTGSS
jgi:glucosamine-6-phosphate deaminase